MAHTAPLRSCLSDGFAREAGEPSSKQKSAFPSGVARAKSGLSFATARDRIHGEAASEKQQHAWQQQKDPGADPAHQGRKAHLERRRPGGDLHRADGTNKAAGHCGSALASHGNPWSGGGGKASNADFRLLGKVEDIRIALLRQAGSRGVAGLGAKFRILDTDRSRGLSLEEFRIGLQQCGVVVNDTWASRLYTHFDTDGNGRLDIEEFMHALRQPLNNRRRLIVCQAFAVADRDGNGKLDVADVRGLYDAQFHPDVVAGRADEDDVLENWLSTFEQYGDRDGVVTQQEWESYYTDVGAGIENDDYFELMIRNAWHMQQTTAPAEAGLGAGAGNTGQEHSSADSSRWQRVQSNGSTLTNAAARFDLRPGGARQQIRRVPAYDRTDSWRVMGGAGINRCPTATATDHPFIPCTPIYPPPM
jgi:Ca2+-binding EF-hand superfamily protein